MSQSGLCHFGEVWRWEALEDFGSVTNGYRDGECVGVGTCGQVPITMKLWVSRMALVEASIAPSRFCW